MTDITFNYITRQVVICGKTYRLTDTEYRLLWILYIHAGKTVEYDTLLTNVWGKAYRGELKYLQDYIRFLRKKLEPDPKNPTFILNIRGYGYRLTIIPGK